MPKCQQPMRMIPFTIIIITSFFFFFFFFCSLSEQTQSDGWSRVEDGEGGVRDVVVLNGTICLLDIILLI